ncbi:MAG TPA: helicase-associated domain-containing protein, partial [Dehalococcoidia bacterium]|nr:helicase-associated domain-containing protein [Dehalococcoidia bacterium]
MVRRPSTVPALIVRPNGDLLLDSTHSAAEAARHRIGQIADLVKTPHPFYQYRLSRFSVWNALAAGWSAETILAVLTDLAESPPPVNVRAGVERLAERFGRFRIVRRDDELWLTADPRHLAWAERRLRGQGLLVGPAASDAIRVDPLLRGTLKLALCRLGFPAEDLGGYDPAEAVPVELRSGNGGLTLRAYQQEAVDAFLGGPGEGHGVVVLPCGAGKTLVGIGALAALKLATLILVPGGAVARQWHQSLTQTTSLAPEQIGECSGDRKEVGPVTVATYQTAARQLREGRDLFAARAWG